MDEISNEIVDIIDTGLGALSVERRKELMDELHRVTQYWLKVELEYWEKYADEKKERDDYRIMQFVLEDVCGGLHDKIAADLSEQSEMTAPDNDKK